MGSPILWVDPFQVTEDDINWLQQADAAGPAFQSIPLERLFAELYSGQMHLFRLQPGPGVILVEVIHSASNRRRLNLVRAGGKGLGWSLRKVARALQHLARDWDCTEIQTNVYSPRLATAMRLVGGRAESVCIVLEVD